MMSELPSMQNDSNNTLGDKTTLKMAVHEDSFLRNSLQSKAPPPPPPIKLKLTDYMEMNGSITKQQPQEEETHIEVDCSQKIKKSKVISVS